MPRSNTTPLRGKPSDSGASASSGAGGASSSVGGGQAWDSNEPPQNVVNALQLNLMQETMEGRIALRPGDVAAKGGGTKNTTLYRAMQMEYMRWHGANPNNPGMLRGVELSKRTWKPNAEGPVVSRNWVVLFAQEVYTKGYKFLSGRKKTQYDSSPLWWKKFYQTQCYNKTLPNDSDRTYGAKRKKRNASGGPGSSSSRKQPEALTWLGSLDKMLHALEDLKTQQLNTDPAWCAKVYTTNESKQLLRPGKKGGQKDPRFAAIKVLMQNRQKSSDAGKERDKFSDTLVDSLTFDKHLEMLNWYMERGTYAGALQAMNAAAKFVAALRPSDTRALVLSDMGVDLTGQIVKMPWLDNHPVLGFLYLGKNADTNKSEMSFYLPHMRDEANLFFYKGHYFFWRWKILNGLQPDFSPLDEAESQACASADSAASSAGGGAGATSSSTCKWTPPPPHTPSHF